MRIVDSQVHIWGANTPERPWPGRGKTQREVPLGHQELISLMDEAGVDAAVIVPPSWEGDRNDLALAAYQAHPDRFAIMGRLDPEAPASRGALATWREQAGMFGLRFTLHRPEMFEALSRGGMDWMWSEAERLGVHIMILVPQEKMHLMEAVVARYTGLKLTLDHMAVPSTVAPAERFSHLDKLIALAKYPNVAVKVSALPCIALDEYPYRSVHPHVRRVYDAFGPRRMFWGSDVSRLPCTYRQCITMFTEEMPWLNETDKEWIMGRALCEWLQWTIPETRFETVASR